ncbi:aminotransferase class V-fold PLP-dependent enzyme [bacterium]|nr:aminotransferase class V-fold PLP-dependent enzyme [bacterium]
MKTVKKRPSVQKPSAGSGRKASGRMKTPAARGPKHRISASNSSKHGLSVPLCEAVGGDTRVPVAAGAKRRYVNLDNAASTPAIRPVLDAVVSFAPWYSNVHRGTGFKSKLSSRAFDRSRELIYRFVRATPERRIVLFTRNTTESINHLASRFPFQPDDVVLTTVMEHHSNELPWRKAAHVVHVNVLPDGRVDEADFRAKLDQYRGRVALVAVTGASNVTGYINPVHDYARRAHAAGARIFVDAAQLAPHRPIDMKDPDDPEALDFIAFSAHKMYAPFGAGVLVGERSVFEKGEPSLVGGGAVDIVNLENAYWTDLPDREEAGTPDIVGAVALGAAIRWIEKTGWDKIIRHEAGLTAYALEKLKAIPGVSVYGDTDPASAAERLGVIPLNVGKLPHSLVSAVLGAEWAIGTRNGCFCAHPYVKCLLHVGESEAREMEKRILNRDRSIVPGAVRVSFGVYNTKADVDALCEALAAIASGRFLDGYELDKERGEYSLRGMTEDYGKYFKEIAD